jgi:transposase InsO family protein
MRSPVCWALTGVAGDPPVGFQKLGTPFTEFFKTMAPSELRSFFAAVTKEPGDRFPSYGDAKMAVFDYIEVFYNQRRRHSTLGQISPAAFEARHTAA